MKPCWPSLTETGPSFTTLSLFVFPLERQRATGEGQDQVAGHFLFLQLLFSTVLYSTLLNCTLLFATVLYVTLLYSTVLYCTLHFSSLLYRWRN